MRVKDIIRGFIATLFTTVFVAGIFLNSDSPLRIPAIVVALVSGTTITFWIAHVNSKDPIRQGIVFLTETIENEPNNPQAYVERGNFYKYQRKFKEAYEDYEAALAIDSNFASAHISKGNLAALQGRRSEAITDYDQALTVAEDEEQLYLVYYNRGIEYFHTGEYEQALRDWLKAIELKPDDSDTLNNLGRVYESQKQYEEAIVYFRRFLETADPADYQYPNPNLISKAQSTIKKLEKRLKS